MSHVLCWLSAVMVAVGCVVVGSCGGEEETPVLVADVVGTYVLDKEATLAAVLKAVEALADDATRDPDSEVAKWRRELLWRASALERGLLDVILMLKPDSTWEAERNVDGHHLPSRGTYARDGIDLVFKMRGNPKARRLRIHGGLLERRCPYGHTYEVLQRLPDDVIHEGLQVDILFDSPGPQRGDLLTICGEAHPDFPPIGSHCFDAVDDLGFTQEDDYFGIRPRIPEGDDVAVWLYPLVKGEAVHHHPGPFDGVRLHYNVLRNPERRAEMFLRAVKGFAAVDGVVGVTYVARGIDLGLPPDLDLLKQDIRAVLAHWWRQGIEIGSDDALRLD